jgi:hypothetical protein
VLGTLNLIFLLIGSAIIALAGVMRWGTFDINKIVKDETVQLLVGIGSLDVVLLVLLAIGAGILFTSFLGLLGVCCNSRLLLSLYAVAVGLNFVSHFIVFVLLVTKGGDLETPYINALNTTVLEINQNYPITTSSQAKCDLFRLVSKLGDCCGLEGPSDFGGNQNSCCHVNTFKTGSRSVSKKGCLKVTVDFFKDNFLTIVIIPNVAVLAFGASVLFSVPFLIARFGRKHH